MSDVAQDRKALAPLSRLQPAALCLAGLALLFYASYGFANWVTGLRQDVGSIVFGWERHIPFLEWTILPYWSTNLLYAASVFLCRSRAELRTHVSRLVAVQAIAVAGFLLFPLRFSTPRPDVTGPFAFLYEALGAFDRPFNQAPSLHVALTVILLSFYLRQLGTAGRLAMSGWSALVVGSVLTTYQHHVIDIPFGLAAGLVCLWLFPFGAGSRVEGWRGIASPRHRRLAMAYGGAALALLLLAALGGGWMLWLLWPALSLALVALAYGGLGPAAFDKSADGRLAPATRLLLAPYLAGAWINSRLWTLRHAPAREIIPGVAVGRFPSRREANGFDTVIDLAAEFQRPAFDGAWISHPMLDLVAPDPALLRAAACDLEGAHRRGAVLVCCALGYGRSVACATAWLVRSGRVKHVDDAIALLQSELPHVALHADLRAAIVEAIHDR